jgi:hypothetical protein
MKLTNAGNIFKSAVIIFVFIIIVGLPSRVSASRGAIVSVFPSNSSRELWGQFN